MDRLLLSALPWGAGGAIPGLAIGEAPNPPTSAAFAKVQAMLQGASLPPTPASIAALRLVHDCVAAFNLNNAPGRDAAMMTLTDRSQQLNTMGIAMPLFVTLAAELVQALKQVDEGVPQQQRFPCAMPQLMGLGLDAGMAAAAAKRQRSESLFASSHCASPVCATSQPLAAAGAPTDGPCCSTTSVDSGLDHGDAALAVTMRLRKRPLGVMSAPTSPSLSNSYHASGDLSRFLPMAGATSSRLILNSATATSTPGPVSDPATQTAMAAGQALQVRHPHGTILAAQRLVRVGPGVQIRMNKGCFVALLGGVPTTNILIHFQVVLCGSLQPGVFSARLNTTVNGQGYLSFVPDEVRHLVAGAFFVGVSLSDLQAPSPVAMPEGANSYAHKFASSVATLVFEYEEALLPEGILVSNVAPTVSSRPAAPYVLPLAERMARSSEVDKAAAVTSSAAAAVAVVSTPQATTSSASTRTQPAGETASASVAPTPMAHALPPVLSPGAITPPAHYAVGSPGCSMADSVNPAEPMALLNDLLHQGRMGSITPQQQQCGPAPLMQQEAHSLCAPYPSSHTRSVSGPMTHSPMSASTPVSNEMPALAAAMQAPQLSMLLPYLEVPPPADMQLHGGVGGGFMAPQLQQQLLLQPKHDLQQQQQHSQQHVAPAPGAGHQDSLLDWLLSDEAQPNHHGYDDAVPDLDRFMSGDTAIPFLHH